MVRKFKYHEQKLLKKVDFISWEVDNNIHEVRMMRRYHINKREDYAWYNKLSHMIRDLAREIKDLDPKDPFRTDATAQLLDKLYALGIIPTKQSLELCNKVCASSLCRRRLPVLVTKLKMTQSIKMATKFIEQGHIRVGPEVIMDPAFLVTRSMEDFITWVDSSAIRKHVMEYNEMRDDYDMM